jgi:ABC-type xylose transport system permease subunit
MMFLSASGINNMISNSLGRDFVGIYSIVGFPVCYAIGAVLGDWIGKKVGYYLPKWS